MNEYWQRLIKQNVGFWGFVEGLVTCEDIAKLKGYPNASSSFLLESISGFGLLIIEHIHKSGKICIFVAVI